MLATMANGHCETTFPARTLRREASRVNVCESLVVAGAGNCCPLELLNNIVGSKWTLRFKSRASVETRVSVRAHAETD